MKRISYIALLGFCASFLTTCEKFDTKPLTKVETGTATPLATSVTVTAKIIDLSGEGNTDYGFCYATQNNPTISNEKLSLGKPKVGEFTGNVDGLSPNTQYYVRAYCQSGDGIVYGKAVPITTLNGISALTTTAVTNIAVTSAVSGGNITSDGGAAITARGVVWSTSQNPTTTSNQGITSDGTGTGTFTSNLTNLTPGTTYYVRVYATNSVGTSYGDVKSFTTGNGTIILEIPQITSITITSAQSSETITSDGGSPVTEKGICWSINQNPTITDEKTIDGAGMGVFTSSITGLEPNTTYYVRAYAINSFGMVYSNEVSFTTLALTIGDSYGGGKIAYIFKPGDPGYVEGQVHGLISAINDQSAIATWGCQGTVIGSTSSALGTGMANTLAIVSGCYQGGTGARICNDLVLNGYSDWYLPSTGELYILYQNKEAIGGFSSSFYWSSTEVDYYGGYCINFMNGSQQSNGKGDTINVRAIRNF